jgi:Ca2+/Na+ antiporter
MKDKKLILSIIFIMFALFSTIFINYNKNNIAATIISILFLSYVVFYLILMYRLYKNRKNK